MPNFTLPEEVYFLSELLGKKVVHRDRKVGKLTDILIAENQKSPRC